MRFRLILCLRLFCFDATNFPKNLSQKFIERNDNVVQKIKKSNYIQIICALSLFLLFSICYLFLLNISINNYKEMRKETDTVFNSNASLHYITNKIHSYDNNNTINLTSINGIQVLELTENFDTADYHTLVYCYDGYIYELLKQKDQPFDFGNGVKILKADDFFIKFLSNNIVEVSVKNENSEQLYTFISLKCSKISEVDANDLP